LPCGAFRYRTHPDLDRKNSLWRFRLPENPDERPQVRKDRLFNE